MLREQNQSKLFTLAFFAISVGLACLEKLAFIANTVSVERDWIIVVADSLGTDRQDLNSAMRRIDLICKLIAPLCISFVDAYSTTIAIWVVFGQNALSVIFEYFAIAQVFTSVPELAHREERNRSPRTRDLSPQQTNLASTDGGPFAMIADCLEPFESYVSNPAFLASFSLSLLYLTVLSFGSQMTTYLLTVGFTSVHISVMRLVAVALELLATCAAPIMMRKIGAVRSGLWFINEQLISIAISIGLFSMLDTKTKLAAGVLVIGVTLSRTGLWGFDLCVQYLVQEDAPEASRGSFSAIEAGLQNFFELISFATTMIFYKPEVFKIPIYISSGAIAISAACFAGFVRQKRGHLLHTSKCLERKGRKKYKVLPTIEEEDLDESGYQERVT
jgi:iron-regulated transporter 1